MTKLQLALDGDMVATRAALAQARPFIDIVEVGTPLIFREGMRAVRQIRADQPQLTLVADLKIMDAGEAEADIAFEAGADRVTVMAVASDATVSGAVKSARKHGRQVMADMMEAPHPLARATRLLALGVDLLCLHTAQDRQRAGASPYAQLAQLRAALPTAPLAVAGGVQPAALDLILPWKPRVIVVGSFITGASDPAGAAQQLWERIQADGNP